MKQISVLFTDSGEVKQVTPLGLGVGNRSLGGPITSPKPVWPDHIDEYYDVSDVIGQDYDYVAVRRRV